MAAPGPAIRTVHLTRIPLWVSQESDAAIVVPGVSRSIEWTVGEPTVAVTYPPNGHDEIRVEFLSHESAEEAMEFYNSPENWSEEFSMEWSEYNISPQGSPPPGPCPVSYRFPQRDIPQVFPRDIYTPPEAVHPSDPSWFCRYNPLQPEIRRQVHYMWSPRPQPPQNPQAYLLVPPQPPTLGLPQPQPPGLPQPQQRRPLAPQPSVQHRSHPYQRSKPHQQRALAPQPRQQAPPQPPDLVGPQKQGP